MIFKYTKYPKAAKEFLRFMMEDEQVNPWVTASLGYVTPALVTYEKHAVWNDPKATPYRDAMKIMLPSGYAGKMGYASAGSLADFIVVNMVAEAASGSDAEEKQRARRNGRSATTKSDIAICPAGSTRVGRWRGRPGRRKICAN
jgi:multiple sugar transport system substrate-binding protein